MYLTLSEKPEGFTREDMENEIKSMVREALQTEARAAGLKVGVEQLQNALINDVLDEENIKKGDKCVMHFSDGDQTVVFDSVSNGGFFLKQFGSKGRPYKYPTYYEYTSVYDLEKLNAEVQKKT